jgi:deoxyribonuclease IV
MRLGVHVSIAGGVIEALNRAGRLSCNTIQIFSRSPRGGSSTDFSKSELSEFCALRSKLDIDPLVIHAPYIINLASSERVVWERSCALYMQEYKRASLLGARYLVTHVGSHKGKGEASGIRQVARALNLVFEGSYNSVIVLLENSAGSGHGLGASFEHLLAMKKQVKKKEAVGVCLDTAHLFGAGFPIHTQKGLNSTLKNFDSILGLDNLKLVHLNDSKASFNSHLDRHWHIGKGYIGFEAIKRIVNHSHLKDVPFILETPKDSETDDLRNLSIVRRMRGKK